MITRILLLIWFLTTSAFISAQTLATPDEFYKAARDAAFKEKDYNKAKRLANEALWIAPKYAEVQVFLGRLYGWQKQYDSAAYHFQQVINYDDANEGAIIAYTDLEYWKDNYNKALFICESGLSKHPESGDLLLRKARILNGLKRYGEALDITVRLLQKDDKNTAALSLASSLKDVAAVNKIGLNYEYAHFDKQFSRPWHLTAISYSRYTKFGTFVTSLNHANRFGNSGWQAEVEAYPRISKTFYGYISGGYSPEKTIFPTYRAGLSLFANLAKSFEAELGLRYLNFGSPTHVYTLYFGKYYRNLLLGARTYVSPGADGTAQSYNAMARYYMKGVDDYVALSIGSGISPDDKATNIMYNNKNWFNSRQASLTFNYSIAKRNILSLKAGWLNQEFQPGVSGNQVNVSIGFQRRF